MTCRLVSCSLPCRCSRRRGPIYRAVRSGRSNACTASRGSDVAALARHGRIRTGHLGAAAHRRARLAPGWRCCRVGVGECWACLGAIAGYAGGWLDEVLGRVIDVLLAFPGILLAIALVAVLGPGLANVVLALAAIGWVGYARLVRGQVLKLRDSNTCKRRARSAHRRPASYSPHGARRVAIARVQATLGMAGAIIAEASLSFLGWACNRRRRAGARCSTPGAHISSTRRI